MEITIAKNYDFTPEWNNNKQEAKPVVFHMRALTTAERERYLKYEFGPEGGITMIPDRQGLFVSAVLSVDNLVVNGEQVRTAREFLSKPGLDFLFAEAVANVTAQTLTGEIKN